MLARLRSLWRGIRRPDSLNDEMEAEFRLHMELRAQDLVQSGLSPADAARQARLEFGSTESFKDHGRDARGLRFFDGIRFSMLDAKLGARMLRKHPGLTVIGTIAVAFAIAIGSVGFEVVTQAAFPTIPLPNGNEIVALQNWNAGTNGPMAASRRDYIRWTRDLATIKELAALAVRERNVDNDANAVADVTASMFTMTRVPAFMGRTVLPGDERADAPPVVVVGYDYWQNKLAGAPDVIGRVIRISGTPTTIVGVMPKGYGFPRRDIIWRPLHLEQYPEALPRFSVYGRLAPGRTLAEARAEFAAIGAQIAAAFPEMYAKVRAQVSTLPRALFILDTDRILALGSINIFLVVFLALVCGNVALLLFARAASRQVEITVRTALGASRGRIITQLFTEALVLCVVGMGVGLGAASLILQWLWTVVLGQEGVLAFWMHPSVSPTTVLYAIGLTLLAAAIAGIVPALKVTSGGVEMRLRAMSSGGGGLHFGGLWTAIIVAQIALSATLPLVTSALRDDMLSVLNIRAGFAANEFLTASLALDRADGADAAADTSTAERAARFESLYRALEVRLQNEPGVIGVTYGDRLPFMYHGPRAIEMDSGPVAPPRYDRPTHYVGGATLDPRFFAVAGAPILRGRALTAADAEQKEKDPEAARAVVVDESFARIVLGGLDPVGRRVRYKYVARPTDKPGEDPKPGPWYQIVGVVPSLGVNDKPGNLAVARMYEADRPRTDRPLQIAVHIRGDPYKFAPRLRELVALVDPALRVINPMPLPRVVDNDYAFNAFWYHLVAIVSGIALVLSLAGVYSVTAFTVAKRTREIGVRVALGARPRQIILTVFKRPFIQIGLGILFGVILMIAILSEGADDFDIKSKDVVALGAAVSSITVCCMLACVVPTRRALRIQPTEALKDEG